MNKFLAVLPQNTGFIFREALLANKKFLLIKVFQIILSGSAPVMNLFFLQQFIDTLLSGATFHQILPIISFFILVQLVIQLCNQMIYSLLKGETTIALNRLRDKLAISVSRIPYDQLETDEVRDLIQLSSDVATFVHLIEVMTDMISRLVTLSSLSVLIFFHNAYSLVLLLVIVFVRIKIDQKNRLVHETWRIKYAPIMRKSGYFLNVMKSPIFGKEIRVNRVQRILSENIEGSGKDYKKTMINHNKAIQKNNLIIDLVMILQELAIYSLLGLDVLSRRISIGSFAMIAGSINQFSNGFVQIISNWSELVLLGKFATDYRYFVTTYADEDVVTSATMKEDERFSIEFKNVSFCYPNSDKMILDDVSLTIKAGEKIALVGQNGAGKTTFIKLLCGFYKPSQGCILLNNREIGTYSKQEISLIVGAVFQDFKLLPFKVKDVLTGSTDEVNQDELLICLEDSGIKLSNDFLNKSITKEFDEQGIDFSGGERQKLAFASVLYKDAPIILLDEPTAALDAISEYNLYQKFDLLVRGKTAVYISHRLSSTRFVDKIVVLQAGRLVEMGSHEDLMQDEDGLYSYMFNEQAKLYRE